MKISDKIFNIKPEAGEPQPGKFLVAEPFLREYYFNHAVIYILEYALGKECMGMVMNRRMTHSLSDVLMKEDAVGIPDDIPLFCGGPVSTDRLFYLHKVPGLIKNSSDVGNGIYYGGDFGDVLGCLREGLLSEDIIRFFVGYSGWSPYQLEDELAAGTWAVVNIPEKFPILENEDAGYWGNAVRTMGDRYSSWLIQPMNPTDN